MTDIDKIQAKIDALEARSERRRVKNDELIRKIGGPDPIEKHILLLRLTNEIERVPEFGNAPIADVKSPQALWLSRVRALMYRLGTTNQVKFDMSYRFRASSWVSSILEIQSQVIDAIEELKLDLELDNHSDIGHVYGAGDVYKFFRDLKEIVKDAKSEIFVVDPYFDGTAFDNYLSDVGLNIKIKILANKYTEDVNKYVKQHHTQNGSNIKLAKSDKLHDRLVFIDNSMCWIVGHSFKDAANKSPTYLMPLSTQLFQPKCDVYQDIWNQARLIT